MKNTMFPIIKAIEIYCEKNNLNHRFVGGVSFGGLLNTKTTYRINIQKRTIYLKHTNQLLLTRDDGTIRDIDIILLITDFNKIILFNTFLEELSKAYKKNQQSFPLISYEWIVTESPWYKKIFQFVTAITKVNTQLYLSFGSIQQAISEKSLENWQIVVPNNIHYTVRNPIADYLAYQFRNPSGIKPKDIEKLEHLKQLADNVDAQGKKHNIKYFSNLYYGSWKDYIKKLQSSEEISIIIKRVALTYYWRTIGNYFAHGKGMTKYIANLSNKFTG